MISLWSLIWGTIHTLPLLWWLPKSLPCTRRYSWSTQHCYLLLPTKRCLPINIRHSIYTDLICTLCQNKIRCVQKMCVQNVLICSLFWPWWWWFRGHHWDLWGDSSGRAWESSSSTKGADSSGNSVQWLGVLYACLGNELSLPFSDLIRVLSMWAQVLYHIQQTSCAYCTLNVCFDHEQSWFPNTKYKLILDPQVLTTNIQQTSCAYGMLNVCFDQGQSWFPNTKYKLILDPQVLTTNIQQTSCAYCMLSVCFDHGWFLIGATNSIAIPQLAQVIIWTRKQENNFFQLSKHPLELVKHLLPRRWLC